MRLIKHDVSYREQGTTDNCWVWENGTQIYIIILLSSFFLSWSWWPWCLIVMYSARMSWIYREPPEEKCLTECLFLFVISTLQSHLQAPVVECKILHSLHLSAKVHCPHQSYKAFACSRSRRGEKREYLNYNSCGLPPQCKCSEASREYLSNPTSSPSDGHSGMAENTLDPKL